MMSRQPPIRPEQGSYSQFQLETSQEITPYRRDKDILKKLRDSLPQSEAQWQEARRLNGYATAEDVFQKTKDILENRIGKQDLQNFICIATCCVEWHLGQKTKAYEIFRSQFRSQINRPATELTIQKYMSSVRGLIQLMDTLYSGGLRHRAFEATFLYSRIGPSFLTYYNKDPQEFNACFPTLASIEPEIQASLVLSITFIIKYRYSEQYSYTNICEALGTHVLDEQAYTKFVSIYDTGRPIPYVLPQPPTPIQSSSPTTPLNTGQYESATHNLDAGVESPDPSHLEATFALPATFKLRFEQFRTSAALRQKLNNAAVERDDQIPHVVPHTPLLELPWNASHDAVADQIIDDLIQEGAIPQQPLQRNKSLYRHDIGSVAVPDGWIKIIIPSALVKDISKVSIYGPGLEEISVWDNNTVLLLGEGILLSTSHTIFYYSISIPLSDHGSDMFHRDD